MHYANGREAKVGDEVVGRNVSGEPVAGVLVDLRAESDTCNGNVILTGAPKHCVTIKNCLHVEDAFAENQKKVQRLLELLARCNGVLVAHGYDENEGIRKEVEDELGYT
ncbi:MAG: hypothetical protein L6437_00270 [Kiritimatiellae bacterium]|nr:hypothetical protein [Planctomycetota bacterium]MCG2658666.1 hypothetical protein [Kiritimatiellia bacterium]MCG2680734.1 hypothetical protein [Kiritimatiellia bacterium]